MKTITLKEIPLKSGAVIPAGTPCQVRHHIYHKAVITTFDDRVFRMRYQTMHKYIKGFIPFDHDSLMDEELLECGNSFSPTGQTVEIDGYDQYGLPSIHMILLAI